MKVIISLIFLFSFTTHLFASDRYCSLKNTLLEDETLPEYYVLKKVDSSNNDSLVTLSHLYCDSTDQEKKRLLDKLKANCDYVDMGGVLVIVKPDFDFLLTCG